MATLHEQIGATVKPLGILVTMYDKSTALDMTLYRLLKGKVEREYRRVSVLLGDRQEHRRRRVRGRRQPGVAPGSRTLPAASAYGALADEVVGRLKNGVRTVRPVVAQRRRHEPVSRGTEIRPHDGADRSTQESQVASRRP